MVCCISILAVRGRGDSALPVTVGRLTVRDGEVSGEIVEIVPGRKLTELYSVGQMRASAPT